MVAKVIIQVLSDVTNAVAGLGKVGDAADAMGGKLKGIGASMTGIGQQMTVGLTAPIVAGLGLATKSAMDFEKQMSGISRATGVKGLESDIKSLSAQFGLLPPQFGEIAEEVAKAGVTGKEAILGISQTVAKASVLLDLPAKETAEAFGKVSSVYNMSSKEIENFAAKINYLGDEIGGKESEILKIVAASGATASAAKMSAGEITALAATYGRLGVEASVASNSIKAQVNAIFTASTGKSKEHNAVLQQVGLSYQQLAQIIQQKGMSGAILELNNRFNQLQGSSKALAIASFYGNNYNDTIGVTIDRTDLLAQAFQKAGDTSAAAAKAQREWAETQKTTAYQAGVVQSKLYSIGITIGAAILPAVASLLTAVTPLIDQFGKFAEANPKIVQLGVAFLALVAAIGPVLIAVGSVVSAVGAIGTAIGVISPMIAGIGTAITGVVAVVASGPVLIGVAIAAVVAAVVAAGVAIYQNWDWLKSQASAIWSGIANAVKGGIDNTINFIKQLPNTIAYVTGYIVGAIATLPVTIIAVIGKIITGIVDAGQKISSTVTSAMTSVTNTIGNMIKQVPSIVSQGIDAIVNVFKQLPGAISNAMSSAISAVKSALSQISQAAASFGSSVVNSLKSAGAGMMNSFAQGIRDAASAPFNAIQEVVNKVRSYLPSSDAKLGTLSDLTASGSALPATFAYGMNSNIRTVESAASNVANSANSAMAVTRAPAMPVSGGSTTITANFQPQITLTGTATNDDAKKLIETLRPYAREFILMLQQANSRQSRTVF
ncbi:putative bacteriophage protein (plasmid) [Kalymmatonema gypsitolerans NIES-4073]|nr:putative bacteriophage protein [Scytonema sp. NIES-4073]